MRVPLRGGLGVWGVRERRLLWVVAGLVMVIVVGFLVARTVKSPAQRAAETAPPPPTVLTAVVEKRVLTSTLIQRGTVVADRQVAVTPLATGQVVAQVITEARVRQGDPVRAGQVVLAVSGRPLIALPGQVPPYRNLAVGAIGPDVLQLQQALGRLAGGTAPDRAGVFGKGTAAALSRLYARTGYPTDAMGGAPGLPAAEVAWLPSFPAVVTGLSGRVGDAVKAPLVSFASGALRVVVKADPAQAGLVSQGLKAQLDAEALSEEASGVVASKGTVTTAPLPGLASGDPADAAAQQDSTPYVLVEITPDRRLPAAWLGQDIRVTLTSARTKEPVLVAPVSALTTAVDGTTRVTVVAGGAQRAVAVTAGASGDGYVEVTPVSGGRLGAGDRVVTGQ